MRAAAQRTFSTSAAAPRRSGSRRRFVLVLSDRNVRAILVNVFAGINRCDWVAEGVVKACRELKVDVPLVVRLSGTNVEAGRDIIAKSGLPIISADTLAEAAKRGGRGSARRPSTGCAHRLTLRLAGRGAPPRWQRAIELTKAHLTKSVLFSLFWPVERSLAFAGNCFRGSLRHEHSD